MAAVTAALMGVAVVGGATAAEGPPSRTSAPISSRAATSNKGATHSKGGVINSNRAAMVVVVVLETMQHQGLPRTREGVGAGVRPDPVRGGRATGPALAAETPTLPSGVQCLSGAVGGLLLAPVLCPAGSCACQTRPEQVWSRMRGGEGASVADLVVEALEHVSERREGHIGRAALADSQN